MNTTLLLTNRLKPILFSLGLFCGLTGFIIIGSPTTSTFHGISNSDTTKPKQKVIYNHYKLEGSDTLFQLLWLQVLIPDDISPNQNKRLQKWLQSSIKIDSTIKQ